MVVIFALLLAISFICMLFGISIFNQNPSPRTPNGSIFYLPLLGETLSFLKPHKSNSLGIFLQQHCSRYGSVFKSHLFGNPTIVSCDLELNVFVLQNEEKLFQSSYPKPVHDILGKLSMMLVSGELHKKLRSVAVSFINVSKSRPDFLDYVDKMSVSLIDSWKGKRQVFFFKEAKEDEHRAVRKRKKNGEPLNWEDYKNMEFTSHVINEALRCGNLVKFVHRKALKDVKFKEYVIPEGWQVLPIFSATHLDPTLHQRPLEFNPWRWGDPATSRKVTPYGGGLRICPGAELGKLEIAFFFHHLVLNFRWKTREDDFPISCPYLEFKKGLLLDIEQIE